MVWSVGNSDPTTVLKSVLKISSYSTTSTFACLSLVLVCARLAYGQSHFGVDDYDIEKFDFDGKEGIQREFKVEVVGSWEECFYQRVPHDAHFHVSVDVLRGQDRKVDFFIRYESLDMIHEEIGVTHGSFSLPNAKSGTYAVCIDNIYSRFGSKLVYVYLNAFQPQHWEEYVQEIQEFDAMAQNLTQYLSNVEQSVSSMFISQAQSRFNMMHDMYLARGNQHYVSVWSIVQCVVIIICSVVQVYFVRRLFRSTNVTPTTSKPRA